MVTKKKKGSSQEAKSVVLLPSAKEGVLSILAARMGEEMSNVEVLTKLQQADEAVGRKKTSLGTFYPTVKRLENEGLIKGSWGDEVVPGARKRYLRITGTGLDAFNLSRQYRSILEGDQPIEDKDGESIPGLAISTGWQGGVA